MCYQFSLFLVDYCLQNILTYKIDIAPGLSNVMTTNHSIILPLDFSVSKSLTRKSHYSWNLFFLICLRIFQKYKCPWAKTGYWFQVRPLPLAEFLNRIRRKVTLSHMSTESPPEVSRPFCSVDHKRVSTCVTAGALNTKLCLPSPQWPKKVFPSLKQLFQSVSSIELDHEWQCLFLHSIAIFLPDHTCILGTA